MRLKSVHYSGTSAFRTGETQTNENKMTNKNNAAVEDELAMQSTRKRPNEIAAIIQIYAQKDRKTKEMGK